MKICSFSLQIPPSWRPLAERQVQASLCRSCSSSRNDPDSHRRRNRDWRSNAAASDGADDKRRQRRKKRGAFRQRGEGCSRHPGRKASRGASAGRRRPAVSVALPDRREPHLASAAANHQPYPGHALALRFRPRRPKAHRQARSSRSLHVQNAGRASSRVCGPTPAQSGISTDAPDPETSPLRAAIEPATDGAASLMDAPKQAVFIVDDDPAIRETLRDLLESEGYPTAAFPNAGRILTRLHPRVGRMPDLRRENARRRRPELMAQLNAMEATIATIIVTAYGDVAMAVRAMKAGAVDFLQKPVSRDELLDCVGRALDLSERTPAVPREWPRRRKCAPSPRASGKSWTWCSPAPPQKTSPPT